METAAWRTRHNPIANRWLYPLAISQFSVSDFFARVLPPSLSLSNFFSLLFSLSLHHDRAFSPFPLFISWTYVHLSRCSLFLFLFFPGLWLTALMHLHRAAPTGFNPRGELFLFRQVLPRQATLTRETMKPFAKKYIISKFLNTYFHLHFILISKM